MRILLAVATLLAGCDGSEYVCNEYKLQQSIISDCSERSNCEVTSGDLYTLERWKRRCESRR